MKEGIVIKSTGNRYTVIDDNKNQYVCTIKGHFRIEGHKTTNPVAVGDQVEFEVKGGKEYNVIHKIRERKNYIIRKSSNLSKLYHIIAANVDQAILVITMKYPVTTSEFIDRYLITAEAYSIPVLLLFNKTDLYKENTLKEMQTYIKIYSNIGYECLEISALNGLNMNILKSKLVSKISLISGNSGVGKSTIINKIDSKINQKIEEISDYHLAGKHTTTFAEMLPLSDGGYVIDTPGIRGFGIIDFEKDELYHYFPEIFKYSNQCKYHNCIHLNEPGCGVKLAYNKGKISELRYNNYLKILLDEDSKYR